MNSNEKYMNGEVVDIVEYYNFGFGRFSIRDRLENSNIKY